MKKMMTMLLLAATVSTGAMAQNRNNEGRETKKQEMMRSPEDRAKFKAEKLTRKLNLTDAQRQSVYSANLAKAKEMQPVIDQMRASREKRKSIEAKYEASLKQTLSSEQYAQLGVIKAEHKAQRMQHMNRGSSSRQSGYQPAREDMPVR